MSEIKIKELTRPAGRPAGRIFPKTVPKVWGYELHFKNDSEYCAKILFFHGDPTEGQTTSMHFHVQKHETLVVASGVITVEVLNDKQNRVFKLREGQGFSCPPGTVHRLIAEDGPVTLFEASTECLPLDSIRIY